MKHVLLSFNKICLILSRSFEYSIFHKSIFLIMFVFFISSCAPIPTSEFEVKKNTIPVANKTTNVRSPLTKSNLPESATINFQKTPYLRNVYKQPSIPRNRLALVNFHNKIRDIGQHSAFLSNCSLDILKAFVAKGWAPIVMIQMREHTPFISSISHYNNTSGIVHLQNPNIQSKRRLTFKDFEKAWDKESQKRCVIITAKRLNKADVQKVLGEFLPSEEFKQISVNSH